MGSSTWVFTQDNHHTYITRIRGLTITPHLSLHMNPPQSTPYTIPYQDHAQKPTLFSTYMEKITRIFRVWSTSDPITSKPEASNPRARRMLHPKPRHPTWRLMGRLSGVTSHIIWVTSRVVLLIILGVATPMSPKYKNPTDPSTTLGNLISGFEEVVLVIPEVP